MSKPQKRKRQTINPSPATTAWPETASAMNSFLSRPPVFVVDEHNDALKPIFDAVSTGRVGRGLKMLHFDSHPDMGVLDFSNDHCTTLFNDNFDRYNRYAAVHYF